MRFVLALGLILLAPCGDGGSSGSAGTSSGWLGVAAAQSPAHARSSRARGQVGSQPGADDPNARASLEVLAQGLASPDYATRILATEALVGVAGGWALSQLQRQLGDPEPDVRAAAIEALHQRLEPRARLLLATVRDDTDESLALRVLASWALVTPANPCQRNQP